MKHVLIIVNDMIPYALTWGGCQRMYFLASHLIENGFDVDVVALRTSAYNLFGKKSLPNVYFVEGTTVGAETSIANIAKKSWFKTFFKSLIKSIDCLLFNEITPGNGIQTYLRTLKSKKIIQGLLARKKYDVAVISGPPFALYKTINYVKNDKDIKIIMDYRDPWNLWRAGNALCSRREKNYQELVDKIVCTNGQLCDDMAQIYGINRNKYFIAANGYAKENKGIEKISLPVVPGRLNILYTGSVVFTNSKDDYRNPMLLLEAFKQLLSEGLTDINLIFIGAGLENSEDIKKLISEYDNHLYIMGQVSSAKAKAYVSSADICLLLHTAEDNSGKYLISGKAYDYIQMKKFMFSVSKSSSQHSRLLSEYGIGINVENNIEDIKSGMRQCYDMWKNGKLNAVYKNVDVDSFSREKQIEAYTNLINDYCCD